MRLSELPARHRRSLSTIPGRFRAVDFPQVCRAEARALVTLDLGFGDIRAYRPQDYPGLLVLRLRLQSKAHALAAFQRAMPLLGRQPLTGRLWIIEDSQVRIRGEDQAGQ